MSVVLDEECRTIIFEFGLPAPKRDIHRFIDPFSSCHYVPLGAANRQAPLPSFVLPRSFIELGNLTPKEEGTGEGAPPKSG